MSDNNLIRVVLVDDHAQMHRVIHLILGATSDIKLVGQGANGQEGMALCEQYQPDTQSQRGVQINDHPQRFRYFHAMRDREF